MNEIYGYFVNRYWIVEYIQYLQDWGDIFEYSPRAEDSNSPSNLTSSSFEITSSERVALWKEDQLFLSKWHSYSQLFSIEGCEVLQLAMRWIGPIC